MSRRFPNPGLLNIRGANFDCCLVGNIYSNYNNLKCKYSINNIYYGPLNLILIHKFEVLTISTMHPTPKKYLLKVRFS